MLLTLNPTALRMAKTLWSFGHSECSRVKVPKKKIDEFAISVDPAKAAYNEQLHLDPYYLSSISQT